MERTNGIGKCLPPLLGLCLLGCQPPQPDAGLDRCTRVVVRPSAAGWSVGLDAEGGTVLANPAGRGFPVGVTAFPDRALGTLRRVDVPRLNASFLVLCIPPVASGGSAMTLFHILPADVPVRVADIAHHLELWSGPPHAARPDGSIPDDAPDGRSVGGLLFRDSDGDGLPELVEDDTWLGRGTITYHHWDGRRFRPLWIEHYVPGPPGEGGEDFSPKLVFRRRCDTPAASHPARSHPNAVDATVPLQGS